MTRSYRPSCRKALDTSGSHTAHGCPWFESLTNTRRRVVMAARGPRSCHSFAVGAAFGRPKSANRAPRAGSRGTRGRRTRGRCRESPRRSQHAPLAKADEPAGLAQDEMVEDLDPEELAPGDEPACESNVLGRRLGIAAGVVVSQQEGGTAGEDRGLEHFAGMNKRAREAADGDGMQAEHAVPDS